MDKFVSGFLDTNTYVMEEDRHLLVIDPANHAALLERCRDAATVTVLLTHEHFDHIGGLNRIRDLQRIPTCNYYTQLHTKQNIWSWVRALPDAR